jgi:hypothetical protein
MAGVVPKRKVAVVIRLASGETLRGSVFLDFIDVIHRGEQTLLDKFNDDYAWFPFLAAEGSRIEIVNRDLVTQIEPGDGVPAELVCRENSPVFRRELVTIALVDGRRVEGRIAMDLPDEFSRVSDFLTFPQNFFAVESAPSPILISKRHVRELVPLEKPPALPDSAAAHAADRAR